jgi:DNA mismatch repair protein MutL
MTIQRLAAETIGKIAAGEVIERPAAAVKELVENAIDAGSSRIEVLIAGGGIELLEVRDDGCGIPFDDLALAVERHATSKLSDIADLNNLSTLGFRGEALSSLAAISDLRIASVARGESTAGVLRARFGTIDPPRTAAFGVGTAISARDLFENVPARRKFLRQPSTEAGYVTRVVSAYALAYPAIGFSLNVDGRTAFATDGQGDAISAATAVWGSEVAEALVSLSAPVDLPEGFVVEGVVSLPALDRATRQQQFIFAQGRLIQSRQLGTAFEQAYHTLLMIGRHPLGCLHVRVPADRIDINVHPTKAEVRFADERLVFAMVQRSVREALISNTSSQPIPLVVSSPLTDTTIQRRMALAHPEWTAPRLDASSHDSPAAPFEDAVTVGGKALPVLRVLGQVANMFVIAEGPDGLYLIDQHAAHERILFELLFAAYTARAVDQQLLLNPLSMSLSAYEMSSLDSCWDDLNAFGFSIERFGGSTVIVRAVPAILKIRDIERTVRLILDEMVSGGRGTTRLESLAISAACHTSIRAGQPLSLLEMRELVAQLEQCSSPLACGHGRPTMLRMTAEELEHQFSRR